MKKSRIIITVILALAACAAISAALITRFGEQEETKPVQTTVLTGKNFADASLRSDRLYHYSGSNNIYYTLSPTAYYKYSSGKFTSVKPAKKLRTTVSLPGTSVTLEIPIITAGARSFGVCEWVSPDDPAATPYSYIFAYLTDLPAGTPYSRSEHYLLCLDTQESPKDLPRRMFSENFAVTKSGKVRGYITSERNRMVESNGQLRTDQNVLTADLIKSARKGKIPVLSGFMYGLNDEEKLWDLRTINGSYTGKITTKISGAWAKMTDKGYVYLRKSGDCFKVIQKSYSGKDTTLASYEGSIDKDYIRNGDLIVKKDTPSQVSNLLNGKSSPLAQTSAYKALDFSTAGNKYTAVLGKTESGDVIALYDTDSGEVFTISGKSLFDENGTINVTPDGTVIFPLKGKSVIITKDRFKALSNK